MQIARLCNRNSTLMKVIKEAANYYTRSSDRVLVKASTTSPILTKNSNTPLWMILAKVIIVPTWGFWLYEKNLIPCQGWAVGNENCVKYYNYGIILGRIDCKALVSRGRCLGTCCYYNGANIKGSCLGTCCYCCFEYYELRMLSQRSLFPAFESFIWTYWMFVYWYDMFNWRAIPLFSFGCYQLTKCL